MKKNDLNLTIDELDHLCRLYMDCKLTVLEEKELEYILSTSTLTSSSVDEVRALMNVQLLPRPDKTLRKKSFRYWKYIAGAAASLAVLLTVAISIVSSWPSGYHDTQSGCSIVAYSKGKRLSDKEAVETTNIAMAKADSLMRYASLTERNYMIKANDIIAVTTND